MRKDDEEEGLLINPAAWFFKERPQSSLWLLPVFWLVVGFFFITFLVIVALISCNLNLIEPSIDPSYEGFGRLLLYYRFPLGFLFFLIPSLALVASIHRSVQTKEQIRLSNEQNNFSNRYKHIEEFETYVSNHFPSDSMHFKVRHPRKLYEKLFPRAISGDFSISADYFNDIEQSFRAICSCLDKAKEVNSDDRQLSLNVAFALASLMDKYSLVLLNQHEEDDFLENDGPVNRVKRLLFSLKIVARDLMCLMEFDVSHEPPYIQALERVRSIDVKSIDFTTINVSGSYQLAPFDAFDLNSQFI